MSVECLCIFEYPFDEYKSPVGLLVSNPNPVQLFNFRKLLLFVDAQFLFVFSLYKISLIFILVASQMFCPYIFLVVFPYSIQSEIFLIVIIFDDGFSYVKRHGKDSHDAADLQTSIYDFHAMVSIM